MAHFIRNVMAGSIGLIAAVCASRSLAQVAKPVDVLLVLAIDCSYSVDAVEYNLQLGGIANALRSPEVAKAIQNGPYGAAAISIVEWSSSKSQTVAVPWTRVSDEDSLRALARQVETTPRTTADGATSISAAIAFSGRYLKLAPFPASRQLIDVSSDGRNNQGPDVKKVATETARQGITVNALAIRTDQPTLDIYFRQNVIAGAAAFVELADSYKGYEEAIKRKMVKEIRYIPIADARGPETQGSFITSQ